MVRLLAGMAGHGSSVAERLRHRVRQPLSCTPILYDAAVLLRPSKRALVVRRDSALLIEGFPRSANTYSVAAFRVSNGARLHVGRHLHAAAHVGRSVRLGVPAILLIREPGDAVLSYLIRRPRLTLLDGLREYVQFYRSTWNLRDQVIIAPFDRVTADFGSILDAVNRLRGTNFSPYERTPDNEAACFRLVEEMNMRECGGEVVESHVGRPSQARSAQKSGLLAEVEVPRVARLLHAARSLHRRYVAVAEAQSPGASGKK